MVIQGGYLSFFCANLEDDSKYAEYSKGHVT